MLAYEDCIDLSGLTKEGIDAIADAKAAGDFEHASKLGAVLHHFIRTHPSN